MNKKITKIEHRALDSQWPYAEREKNAPGGRKKSKSARRGAVVGQKKKKKNQNAPNWIRQNAVTIPPATDDIARSVCRLFIV